MRGNIEKIRKGEKFNNDNVTLIRTGKNNKLIDIEKIFGKKSKTNIKPYTVIKLKMFTK